MDGMSIRVGVCLFLYRAPVLYDFGSRNFDGTDPEGNFPKIGRMNEGATL